MGSVLPSATKTEFLMTFIIGRVAAHGMCWLILLNLLYGRQDKIYEMRIMPKVKYTSVTILLLIALNLWI